MNLFAKILLLAVIFMDPCNPAPRRVAVGDLDKACESETTRMYVRFEGRLKDRGDIDCADRPGGVHCKVWLGESHGGDGPLVPAFIKAFSRRPDFPSGRNVIMLRREPPADFKSFTVGFDEVEIYDRDGAMLDHTSEPVVFLGPLEKPADGSGCSQRVLYVERG